MNEREKILALYRGLRVADVCDGLDAIGIMDQCTMHWEIKPLWRDIENFRHRICGLAHTVRYAPTNRIVPRPLPLDDYRKWRADYYAEFNSHWNQYPIQKGDVMVFDAKDVGEVGFIGSSATQKWINEGAVGCVTNAGCRDTDELIKQGIPVYAVRVGRGIRGGRLEWAGQMVPISCGGVMVNPGDVVVADGDGVIVVPRQHAERVAELAREELERDQVGRRRLYEEAGMKPDWTLGSLT